VDVAPHAASDSASVLPIGGQHAWVAIGANGEQMSTDTEELDALASALNRSAERLQTLWFTFLAVTLYLAISAFTTTHRMLFLEEGQKLPILEVKLPLLPFYIIAPAFYVVLHAYMLIMLVLLARTARTFENALNAPGLGGMTNQDRERYRMRMENTIFLQIIVGGERERLGANGRVLRAIALISLAVAPVLVLLLFQLMFLPYHSEAITWWHRGLIFIDLVLVWTFWPSYRREGGERMLPRLRPLGALVIRSAASVLVLAFSVLLATFPSERVHGNGVAAIEPNLIAFLFGSSDEPIFKGVSRGLFANRLWLANESFVDSDKLRKLEVDNKIGNDRRPAFILDFKKRNLANADLENADLRGINFEETILRNALLNGAWLQGASLDQAELQGALLNDTQLRGASLTGAQLQGAWLIFTQLQGASLDRAELQGAMLYRAQLQGASLDRAELQGATLTEAQLQGASLDRAELQGASLFRAELQGASLTGAQLQGAWLEEASVWRTRGAPTTLELTVINHLFHAIPKWEPPDVSFHWQFPDWRSNVLLKIPQGQGQRSDVDTKLSVLDPERVGPADQLTEKFWEEVAKRQPVGQALQDARAQVVREIACAARNGPYVTRGIVRFALLDAVGEENLMKLAALFDEARRSKPEDKVACPGARGLTYRDLEYLCLEIQGSGKVPMCEQ
jgi:uncharacterized protein YjbI with pentapeptide repeats